MGNGTPTSPPRHHQLGFAHRRWSTSAASSNGIAEKQAATSPHYAGTRAVWLGTPPVGVGGVLKRALDIAGASVGIVLLFTLFCLIALAIKLFDRGPIFFCHRRVGLNGSAFGCLKFRTMVIDADEKLQRHLARNRDAALEWEQTSKLKCDPRITPLGQILRKTSLDELPQLLNILRGEMSLVGPRPIVQAEIPKYGDYIRYYLRVRPGLTGLWQVNGRNDLDFTTRVALDRQYVEQWSFWRDLTIIARTVRVIVTSRGCY
jgi:exopolysaccharide production protein ExoY